MEDSKARLLDAMWWPLLFVALIWLIHSVQFIFGWDFGYFGIYPLRLSGLKGIIFTPLIHGDFSHLIHNTIPFFVLATIMFYFYPKVSFRSIGMIYILSGIGVWLFARTVYHIGASGVVYGLMAFILGTGIFRRNIKSVTLALIVFLYYSGMLVGLFPVQTGVSWEGHLSGAIVGIFTAFFYKLEIETDEIVPVYPPEPDLASRPYFLPRDTFEKTRAQRIEEARLERQRRIQEAHERKVKEELERQRKAREGDWESDIG